MINKISLGLSFFALSTCNGYNNERVNKYRPPPGTPWHNEKVGSKANQAPEWPINYPVPDLGLDHDILDSQKHLAD